MHCRLAISTHTYFISLHFRVSKCDMGERKGGRTEKINTKQKPWRPFAWLGGRLFGLWCLGAGRILQGEQLGCGGGGSPFFFKNYYLLADCFFCPFHWDFFVLNIVWIFGEGGDTSTLTPFSARDFSCCSVTCWCCGWDCGCDCEGVA